MSRNIISRSAKETVAIVGDGQTERIYFADVRDTDRPANLSIFPDYPRKLGSYEGVLERAVTLKAGYDRVFALIDMDKIIQDNTMAAYQQDKANAEASGVIVLENNPCFEIWLLLHFVYTGRLFSNCTEVVAELGRNNRIPNYAKSQKFLTSAKLYQRYKGQLQDNAIPNAIRLEINRAAHDILYPRAETFRFFEWYFQQHP